MAPRGKGPPSDGVLKAPEPQTDLDQTQVTENAAVNSAVNTPDSQTDPIMKVQPRKRVSARDILPSADKDISEAETAVEPTTRTRIKMEAPMPNTEILAIDDELGVQTELEKARDKFLDLIESLKTGRYLTDRIQGVEKHSDGGMPRAVIYHGDYKVILMASMVVDLPRDLRDRTPNEMYLYMLQKRLGSEIDYVVKGIDQNTGMAVASRKEAMATKRRHYYLNLTREGTFRVYEGLVCETRVISVIPDGIFVELFGIDVYIPLRELSHTRIPDAMGYFEPGDRILVKITKLDRSDPKDIYVAASVKQV
ncbi:MAG: S1 RNA-binding domain-containing protein, partial [Oscillospiraceae bacterium]|nr:S1 RNA-binding domain-containing protein [Oscillospiraceae bacterium]